MSRYARQTALPELGAEGQARLRGARVLVIGAGGLAAPVLPYLVGAGIGAVTLVDGDVVSESNLHRQTLFRMSDLGTAKVEAAAQSLRDLNPDCMITPHAQPLDPDNAGALVAGSDVVLDCADSFAVSYTLSDACMAAGVALISASVVGLSGYAGGFCGGAPSLRAVFPDLPARAGSCATDGVLGPVVGVIGSLQAQMALGLIAGIGPSPLGRIVSYDALGPRFGGFGFHGAPEPEQRPAFIARAAIRAGDTVIDLRRAEEGPLPRADAQRFSVETISELTPPEGARVVLCCRSGLRAWAAAEQLISRWEGDIALVALGDQTGSPETTET